MIQSRHIRLVLLHLNRDSSIRRSHVVIIADGYQLDLVCSPSEPFDDSGKSPLVFAVHIAMDVGGVLPLGQLVAHLDRIAFDDGSLHRAQYSDLNFSCIRSPCTSIEVQPQQTTQQKHGTNTYH